jgi:enoyl-CoA hydratase/carnithine racemase
LAEEIELNVQGDLAFLRLNRADAGNALRGSTFDAVRKAALRLSDSPPRFLVIAAEGADFCVGLEHAAEPVSQQFDPLVRSRDTYRAAELVGRLRGSIEAIARLPCPVIAAIEGRCHGAGLELALMADLRVAGASATFAFGEGAHGVLPGLGGLGRLSLQFGPLAADLALTGRRVALEEALRCGLVHRGVADGAALGGATELVQELRRTGTTARLQSLLALRAMQAKRATDLQEIETQAAARTWISGEYTASGNGSAR